MIEPVDWFAGRPIAIGALQVWRHFGAPRPIALRALEVDGDSPWWCHEEASELLYVGLGRGTLEAGPIDLPLQPGLAVHLPAGMQVRLRSRGTARLFSFVCPDPGPEPTILLEPPDSFTEEEPTWQLLEQVERQTRGAHQIRPLVQGRGLHLEVRTFPPGRHTLGRRPRMAVCLRGEAEIGGQVLAHGACTWLGEAASCAVEVRRPGLTDLLLAELQPEVFSG